MPITRVGVMLIAFFSLVGLAHTFFIGPSSGELILLAIGPCAVILFIAARTAQDKLSFLHALKVTLAPKTAPMPLFLLLLVWAAVVWTDMNSCHLGREQGDFADKKKVLEYQIMLKERARLSGGNNQGSTPPSRERL